MDVPLFDWLGKWSELVKKTDGAKNIAMMQVNILESAKDCHRTTGSLSPFKCVELIVTHPKKVLLQCTDLICIMTMLGQKFVSKKLCFGCSILYMTTSKS